ncbi:MAG: hypothetical protein EOM05_08525 [Clostridia bacterium]|jgi:hypothetical protein|nr:hypothetical protein [Bacteroidales bacterium]MDD2388004.1 hypothetical protein [Bacteroidales bacterium]NCC87896.1 hypothetical protein [Clostridia bacterium]
MNSDKIFGIIISVLLSLNGVTLSFFVANVRELKKIIQDLALSIKGSQKDIEYLSKSIELHEKILEKHSGEIDELKIKAERTKGGQAK